MKVVCISGKAQSGKDTTAAIMQKMFWGYGDRVLVTHYADVLKYICQKFFRWDGKKDDYGRSLLQIVGTDRLRAHDENYFVDFITNILKLFKNNWDVVIIPDTRFPNEIKYMKDEGFDVYHIRVMRNNFDNGLSEEQKAHPSETALDDFPADILLTNDGNYVDLTKSIMDIVTDIQKEIESTRDTVD